MPISGPLELLDAAESLGFLSNPQASSLRSEWASSAPISADEAASRLVQQNLLTRFQSQRLLEGDGKSLVVGGRYRIRELLGAGGMGQVFLAQDIQLSRSVALKVLPPALVGDDGAVARFKREAVAMARLAHPNIVQAHDAGSDGAQHFLIMEHVEGANLGHMLKQGRSLEPAVAADYAYQAALGLEHAHQKGIVHRDFKPGNVIITRSQQVKVLDLGLARFLQDQIEDETLTQDGAGLGTPDYMAPEQFGSAKHADARSDVYALGCSLYHMITGRVPFPGSSLSEKQRAHAKAEPEPIEALAPNVPAGLAQAVSKMMAKRPADRFQTAGQCADALLPYVAASSASLPNLRTTASWAGGQLSLLTAPQRRKRNLKWTSLAAAILVLGSAAGFGLSKLSDRNPPRIASNASPPSHSSPPAPTDRNKPETSSTAEPAPIDTDPWVLTVSQDPKAGGQYRTINDALKDVKPGMTVRVIDGATYKERLMLTDADQFAGVTLEATDGAMIENDGNGVATISLWGVPEVTIRGFRFHASGTRGAHFHLKGECPGVVLEDLTMTSEPGTRANGVEPDSLNRGESKDGVVTIQRCRFERLAVAVPMIASRRILLRENVFRDLEKAAVQMLGSCQDLMIAGNIFDRCGDKAIHFLHPGEGGGRVAIVNNTFVNNPEALRIEDKIVPPSVFRVENNLVLRPRGPDMAFFRTTDPNVPGVDPGDVGALRTAWTFSHNWRETSPHEKTKAWIPPAKTDVVQEKIEGINRDPTSPDYLRPAADSPLATQGAGNTEPSLPRYIGALPPPGVDAWDWDRTWLAPPGTSELLTVSQDPTKGGQYRTVSDALKDAKPWTTIRVLDDQVYAESISLNHPDQHRGIVLETGCRATLSAPLAIANVPDVEVRGFRIRAAEGIDDAVTLTGNLSGGLLDRLEFSELGGRVRAIVAKNVNVPATQAPLVIQRSQFIGKAGGQGIKIIGGPPPLEPSIGVCVRDNRLERLIEAVEVEGNLESVQISGNVIHDCVSSGVDVQYFSRESQRVLIANNTILGGRSAFRVIEKESSNASGGGDAELVANLFLDAKTADCVRLVEVVGQGLNPADGAELISAWRVRANWRDLSGASASQALPYVEGPFHLLPDRPFESRDQSDPNFMRPKTDSPLATGGAGGDLPTYAGAIPPEGIEPWDWDITWRSGAHRALSRPDETRQIP